MFIDVETGQAVMFFEANGFKKYFRISRGSGEGLSHAVNVSGGRITGMRSWIGPIKSLHSVVIIAQLSIVIPLILVVSQIPAKETGQPSPVDI